MIIYIKLGKVRGIAIEISKELGLKPICTKNSFRHETVIDIPCIQIIYTSGRWRKSNRVTIRSIPNVYEETDQITKSARRVNQR